MPDLMRHVRALSVDIGSRGSTQRGEAAGAEYILKAMRSFTHRVWVEPFRSFTSFSWPWGILLGGGTMGGLMLWVSPLVATQVATLFVLLFLLQACGFIELGDLLWKRPSQNVVGVVAPTGAVRERVVLVAHYDTAKTALNFSPGQVPHFRLSFLLMTASFLVTPALALIQFFLPELSWPRWAAVAPTLFLFGSLLTLVDRELRGTFTRGANDNASGVAAMLGIGEHFSRNPLRHTEVWCVATGCEEVGMVGMRAFLDRHDRVLQGANLIILDNCGAGRVKYTLGEGMLRVLPSDPGLVTLAGEVASRHPEWGMTGTIQVLMPTDATPALMRGHKVIAFLGYDERGLLPNWHWHSDVMENVDVRCLKTTAAVVQEMARALDARVASEVEAAGG